MGAARVGRTGPAGHDSCPAAEGTGRGNRRRRAGEPQRLRAHPGQRRPGAAELTGRHPPPPRRPAVRHERHRCLLARLADHQDARRPGPEIPRPAVRHAGRVPEVPRRGRPGRPAVRSVPGHGPDHPRGGELAMAFGRPRQPNDPSIMASIETAVSTVARPHLFSRLWHWRYELGLIVGGLLGAVTIGYTLGLDWLIAVAAATMGILAVAMTWPPSRQALMARAWCVITPHRVRTGCTHAWIQTRDGRLPVVLYTVAADFGERVWLWCRAGITAGDLEAAREILRSACWASDVRVVVNDRRSHIVVLEVIRRHPPESPADGASG